MNIGPLARGAKAVASIAKELDAPAKKLEQVAETAQAWTPKTGELEPRFAALGHRITALLKMAEAAVGDPKKAREYLSEHLVWCTKLRSAELSESAPAAWVNSVRTRMHSSEQAVLDALEKHELVAARAPVTSLPQSPAVVHSNAVIESNRSAQTALKNMGVTFDEDVKTQTFLEYAWLNGESFLRPAKPGLYEAGRLFEIKALPTPSQKGPHSVALLSEEIHALKDRIEQYGYRLVVDSSLPHTRAGAYVTHPNRVVAIRPDSKLTDVLHELQHVEFAARVAPHFRDLEHAVAQGKSLRSVLPLSMMTLAPQKLKRLEELLAARLPSNAVNETMAVDEELRSLGWSRYWPLNDTANYARSYALRHQINDLQKLETLTPTQRETLENAIAELKRSQLLLRVSQNVSQNVGPVVLLAAPFAAIGSAATLSTRSRQVAYDDAREHLVSQRPDGSWELHRPVGRRH